MRKHAPETVHHIDEDRVAVAGDWHGNVRWADRVIPAIAKADPSVRTVLHVGDFWPSATVLYRIDTVCRRFGIDRVLVTLGNHEPWDRVTEELNSNPGRPVQISTAVHLLPRPYRFTIGERKFLSLGGAASVDRLWRTPGQEWWADEAITDQHVKDAIAGGPCDIMVSHETPHGSPVKAVSDALSSNPHGYPDITLQESAESRRKLGKVWDAVRPQLLLHGHMHTPGGGMTPDGRRVISLGCDGQQMNAVLLDLNTLETGTVIARK